MPNKKSTKNGQNKTPKEIKEFTDKKRIEQQAEEMATFAKQLSSQLSLLDLTNPQTKSYQVYSKESLRTYLKNPLSDTNQQNLRKVSQFLYVLSAQYRRIIAYFASQIDLTAYTVIPNVNIVDKNDTKTIAANYENTLRWIEKMNMAMQIFSILVTCWREDVFYGYCYYNDEEEWDKNDFVILPLDGNYCRISSVNFDGTLNCAFDFSYFTGTNEIYLDFWDKEFKKKYEAYKKDSKLRWQELDPERTWVFKVNYDQTDRVIPPLSSLLESIIDLIDLQALTAQKDALSLYKMLIMQLETLDDTDEPDDWKVNLDTVVQFYNKMAPQVPDQVGIAISPTKVTPIEFKDDETENTNKISKANSNLWEAAGVSQLMDSSLSGATAVKNAIIFDGLYASRPIRGQIEARVNRFLDYIIEGNGMRVKYMDVTPYTKADAISQLKDAAALGLSVKLPYAALLGYSPLDMISMTYLENDVLKLQDKWVHPLASSYNTAVGATSKKSGGQLKDETQLTDEGEATKDGDKNADA